MEAGAKGGYYRGGKEAGSDAPWEPVFDDPVFLEKLEKFLKEFAARYDGQPWLRYVDIGSLGDWGEGHTWAGSQKPYGFAALKTHIDLHLKYFKKSQLVVSDDFVYGLSDLEAHKRLHEYVIEHGISYRDDSIGGDTNGDGSTNGAPGDWGWIEFTSTRAFSTACRARVFEPIISIDIGLGPMNLTPVSAQACANRAFSERKP